MVKVLLAVLVLLSALIQVSTVAAQTTTTPLNQQAMPWFMRPQGMPGVPWFYRPPAPVRQPTCRVAVWYPAQYYHTDEWGHTVTWVGYAPQYVCE
jgi:hypothetical protein